jgi:GTP-binding protein EngB required for normal cell division
VLENLADLKDRRYFKEYEAKPGNRLELFFHFNPGKQLKMYMSGQSGVGKSHLIAQLMKEYVRRYEDRRIIMFSQVPQDKDIDDVVEEHELIERELFFRVDLNLFSQIDPKTRKVNKSIPIPTMEQFKRSLCIFDDIDKIPNKIILKNIDDLKNEMLATGRDHTYQGDDIDIIVSNHQILGGVRTSEILQQANFVVLFPQGLSSHGIKTTCMKYLGMEPEQIKKILSLDAPHQYAIVHRDSPSFVLEQRKIWLIK